MADVTGKIYECFTEYLLRRIGWAPGPGSGEEKEFLYERDVPARCHTSKSICAHADECSVFSKGNNLPYGPWYDPDFFLTDGDAPYACIHVTHWSDLPTSARKFWRTMEDHFQYKTLFGREFLSLSFVFVALEVDQAPRLVQDSADLIQLQGWRPATGAMFATSFDASLLFPINFEPLSAFVDRLPDPLPRMNALGRREFYVDQWDELVASEASLRKQVQHCEDLMRKAVGIQPHPRYPQKSIEKLQEVCWRGRQAAVSSRTTNSRYRKGIQHAFIVREILREFWGDRVDVDEAFWRLMRQSPRFPLAQLTQRLGLPPSTATDELKDFRDTLSSIPVKMRKWVPIPLLDPSAGVETVVWNTDLSQFIQSVCGLQDSDYRAFRRHIDELFESYLAAYGMSWVIRDLADSQRAKKKVEYVAERYYSLETIEEFLPALVEDMLSKHNQPPHQKVVEDAYNWPIDALLTAFGLGSSQHILSSLPELFSTTQGHPLRPYCLMNDTAALRTHLLSGVPVGQYFSSDCPLSEPDFYDVIWPLVAQCIWPNIQGRQPFANDEVIRRFKHKRAQVIIASPQLEPIKFLFRSSLPDMEPGPTLRGAFNQLSTKRGWGRSSLTTKASGLDSATGAIIQTQSVFGRKHIADKTRELCARLRSVHLKLADDETFAPESDPGVHYLVVDGDWPIESKINLYEAGFSGIFEIGELDRLSAALEQLGEGQ